ncbi:MAG: hypothetical protein A2804_02475 [Candidatus Pacebacteria bacterium RIFCSPHIGHO2_01_FULL_46_10]|nr:MAG: hypothetical protein A2804_02475 [Candidatus Pacebacteria bacterium RIFCSPHIGHO2_01_FULL_46_10]
MGRSIMAEATHIRADLEDIRHSSLLPEEQDERRVSISLRSASLLLGISLATLHFLEEKGVMFTMMMKGGRATISIVFPKEFDTGSETTKIKNACIEILRRIKRPPQIADPQQLTVLQETAVKLFNSLPKGTQEELKINGYGPDFS